MKKPFDKQDMAECAKRNLFSHRHKLCRCYKKDYPLPNDYFQISEYQRKMYEMIMENQKLAFSPIYIRKAGRKTLNDMLEGKYHIGYDFAARLKWWQRLLVWLGFRNRWVDKNCLVIMRKDDLGKMEVVDVNYGTDKCYLTYTDELEGGGHLTCAYNHKEGEECLMDNKELI